MLSFVLFAALCMQAYLVEITYGQNAGTGSIGNNLSGLGCGGLPYGPGLNKGNPGQVGGYGNIGLGAAGKYGNLANSYGNMAGAYGNVAGAYGNVAGTYGNVAGAYGNVAGAYGNIAGAYGGNGNGEVVVIGELPVSGSTSLTGHVPALGLVQFSGNVPAFGTVTIRGQCGCQNARNY